MSVLPRHGLRLIVADSHKLMRDALMALVGCGLGHKVVAAVGEADGLIAEAERCRPELALIEIGLPPFGGPDAIRALRARHPEIGVLVYGARLDRGAVVESLHLGVRALVSGEAGQAELGEALEAATQGRRYLDHQVAATLAEVVGNDRDEADKAVARLSEREREVLSLLMTGRTNHQCAATMGLSVHTIETHRRNIMAKCEVHNVVDLTRLALKYGIGSGQLD